VGADTPLRSVLNRTTLKATFAPSRPQPVAKATAPKAKAGKKARPAGRRGKRRGGYERAGADESDDDDDARRGGCALM